MCCYIHTYSPVVERLRQTKVHKTTLSDRGSWQEGENIEKSVLRKVLKLPSATLVPKPFRNNDYLKRVVSYCYSGKWH